MPLTLAQLNRKIKAEIDGKGAGPMMISSELEDTLIHFTHGRKLSKGEDVPRTHRAKQPWEHIRRIEEMNIDGVKELYSELCELAHPAADSVSTWFFLEGDRFGAKSNSQPSQPSQLDVNASHASRILSEVLMAAYNSPIITLRVLHKFGLFSQIEALRKYQLDEIPAWRKINALLKN